MAAPEFLALGAPEPWRPVDSLLWGKVMALWLSGSWRAELDRLRLQAILPPERLAALAPAGRLLTLEDLSECLPVPAAPASESARPLDAPGTQGRLREVERRWIGQALRRHRGNLSSVARELGVSRGTLYRRLRDPQ